MKLFTYLTLSLALSTGLAHADASQCRPRICDGKTLSMNQQKILYQALRMVMAEGHNDIINSNPPACDLRRIRGNTNIRECMQIDVMTRFDAMNVNKAMWQIKGQENCIGNLGNYDMNIAYDLRSGPRFDAYTGKPLLNDYTLDMLHSALVRLQSARYCK